MTAARMPCHVPCGRNESGSGSAALERGRDRARTLLAMHFKIRSPHLEEVNVRRLEVSEDAAALVQNEQKPLLNTRPDIRCG